MRTDKDSNLLLTAFAAAQDIGLSSRVACFAARPLTASVGSIEGGAEDFVMLEWANELEAAIAQALGSSDKLSVATWVDIVVGQGGCPCGEVLRPLELELQRRVPALAHRTDAPVS